VAIAQTPHSSRRQVEVSVSLHSETAPRGVRGSKRLRRLGAGALAAFIVVYLILITASWADQLASPRRLGMLLALWGLGLIALVLLVRVYRHAADGRGGDR
jgi:hypothetical protein